MKREEWLAVLQKMQWVPCEESTGPPRYRAAEAYHCTFCAYTVCARCYNAVPTALLFPSRDASAAAGSGPLGPQAGNGEAEARLSGDEDARRQGTAGDDDFSQPRCFLCRTGALLREQVPVHEWTCEGPRPARRLQHGTSVAYDVDVVQRYYTMKEQRDKRALSQAPLVAHFHAAEGPPRQFAPAGDDDDDVIGSGLLGRRPFCEEGASFVFSVQNPRMEVSCVWCAVNRRLGEAHPAFVGDETITPLQVLRCPPSLPGLPSRRFRVGVPYGVYGLHQVHALALYLTDDIFRKATTKLQVATAEALAAEESEPQPQLRQGLLRAGKELPRHVVRPLLVVDVLHRVATGDPVRGLLRAEAIAARLRSAPAGPFAWPNRGGPGGAQQPTAAGTDAVAESAVDGNTSNEVSNAVLGEDEDRRDGPREAQVNGAATPEEKVECPSSLTWPHGLRCEELLLTLDYLLQGRSVAVYGIASKHFFLQHVSQCAELRHHGVAVLDGYCASAARIVHQLRELGKQLRQRQQGSEQALLRSFFARDSHCEPLAPDARSKAPARDQQHDKGQEGTEEYYMVDSPPSDSSRSQSYRTPLRSRARDAGRSESRKPCTDSSAEKNRLLLEQPHLGETPLVREAAGCVPLDSPAPLVRRRERSILLVRGEEAAEEEAKLPLPAKHPLHRQRQAQKERPVGGQPLPHQEAGMEEKVCVWSRRHWLREQSDWSYDVPLREGCGVKRLREDALGEDANADEVASLRSREGRRPRPPRITVSSPEVMRSLRLACRAPLRSCIAWMSLPSITAQGLVSAALPATTPSLRGAGPVTIILLHGVDQLDAPALLELQAIGREFPYRVVLLCSFDDPDWLLSSAAGLLDVFRMTCVHLRSMLLPRLHEMAGISSLSLLTELEAFSAGGGRFNRYANRGGAILAGASLPLHDTIRRILFSLPASFSELLRCMISRQEASGENVFIPMSMHQENFDECGMMVSMARLKAIERELTSNRLAVFNSAENKLMIPQHRKLLRVLEEVLEQREAAGAASGAAAPVEA
ncbi:uncharacterized protein Tco025E_08394 [Trypanosoma conorhini]|uniref:Uncharacterized protein n=1 Tax=Trypanosoma conorhini TaxID=83891 RepID=A0A3R7MH11_9TRYP|nr:uncharacterized protein Tco025E_08394 [Trypanosoma conorhini]RNF02356.1 hypothetical protein Tco025E_08394 [Trypanosoma conorhini]